jgi:hypothetical protein
MGWKEAEKKLLLREAFFSDQSELLHKPQGLKVNCRHYLAIFCSPSFSAVIIARRSNFG